MVLPADVFRTVLLFLDDETLLHNVPRVSSAWHAAVGDELLWRARYLATWRQCSVPADVREARRVVREVEPARVPLSALERLQEYERDPDACHCGLCNAEDARVPPVLSRSWRGSFAVRLNIERDLYGDVCRRTEHGQSARRLMAKLREGANELLVVGETMAESHGGHITDEVHLLSGAARKRHERALAQYGTRSEAEEPEDAIFSVAEELAVTACLLPGAAQDRTAWELWVKMRSERAIIQARSMPEAVHDKGRTLAHFHAAEQLCERVTQRFRSLRVLRAWATALFRHASVLIDEERAQAEVLLRRSWELLHDALEMDSEPSSQFYNSMGDTADMLAQTQLDAERMDQWFVLAMRKYETARALDVENGPIINNIALSYHNHAIFKTGEPAKQLLRRAIELYEEALRNDDERYVVLYNEGDALMQLSHNTPDQPTALLLLERSIERYNESCRINSHNYSALNNLGWTWLERANRAGDTANVAEFLDNAQRCFERALELMPNYHIAISNMGNVVLERARRDNAPEHWAAATAHYRRALELRPQFAKAVHYIGLAMMERARRLPKKAQYDAERRAGYVACVSHCAHALMIKPCYPHCAFTCAQAAILLGDHKTASNMVSRYNTLTGSHISLRNGSIPLTVQVIAQHNSDLMFNFKSYPWKYVPPDSPSADPREDRELAILLARRDADTATATASDGNLDDDDDDDNGMDSDDDDVDYDAEDSFYNSD